MLCNIAGHKARNWAPNYLRKMYLDWQGWTDGSSFGKLSGFNDGREGILVIERTDVNIQCAEYGTALQATSEEGHKDIIEILLSKGTDVSTEAG